MLAGLPESKTAIQALAGQVVGLGVYREPTETTLAGALQGL